MSAIKVKVGLVKSVNNEFHQNAYKLSDVENGLYSLKYGVDYRIRNRRSIGTKLNNAYNSTYKIDRKLRSLESFIESAIDKYSAIERNLTNKALNVEVSDKCLIPGNSDNIITIMNHSKNPGKVVSAKTTSLIDYLYDSKYNDKTVGGLIGLAGKTISVLNNSFIEVDEDGNINKISGYHVGQSFETEDGEGKFDTSASAFVAEWDKKGGAEYNITDGEVFAQYGVGGGVKIGEAELAASYGLASVDAKAEAGAIGAEAKAMFSLMEDGKFDPSASLALEAEASGVKGEIQTQYGSEDYNVHIAGEGTVGKAEAAARGTIDLSNGEVGAELKASAAVFEGEVSGGFTIFGYKVDLGAGGKALAVGAEAKFGVENGKFDVECGLSAVLGIKFRLTIEKT